MENSRLIRQKPKQLIQELPVLKIIPIEAHRLKLQVASSSSSVLLTSTETIRRIRDGERGEGMEMGGKGDYNYIYRYTVNTRMTPA